MIRKTIYILILGLGVFLSDVSAQNGQALYYMNIPQNHLLNPALRPSNSFYIGLPGLSGTNLSVSNNFISFSDVFIKGQASDSIITFLHPDYNSDKFLNKINDKNFFEPQALVQTFGVGFTVGDNIYMFLDINEKVEGNFVLPGDIFELALRGNEGFVGKTIDLSSLRGEMKYYREYGFGFSRNFTDKLRIGGKGKVLTGIASLSTDNRSLGITVNNDYTHTLNADVTINASAPLIVNKDADNNIESISFDTTLLATNSDYVSYLLSGKNLGFGIDLGATYDISDKIMVSAALTNLGFIKWKSNVFNFKSENQFEFSGLNMNDVINGSISFDSLASQMADSLKNAFKISDSNDPFTTFLPFGVTLGGSYYLTNNISVGLLSYTRFIGKQVRESLTLSTNLNISNTFSASLAYTIANKQYDNLGAGMAFRAGIFQLYLMADRIPLSWNKIIVDNSTIPLPLNWNTINLRFGLNLTFGNNVRKRNDKPMVLVE